MAKWLYRLGAWSSRKRKTVIIAGLTLLIVMASLGLGMGTAFTGEMTIPGTKSDQAAAVLKSEFPTSDGGGQIRLIFKADQGMLTSEANQAKIEKALKDVQTDLSVVSVANPYETMTLSADKKIGYADITYKQAASEVGEPSKEHVLNIAETLTKNGVQTELGGSVAFSEIEVGGVSEVIGILIAFMILAFTFTSFLAAGLPILTAVIGLGIGLMTVIVGSNFVSMSSFSITLAVMLALAVGIDYALFIISRYRQQLAEGYDRDTAIAQANATAGGSVVFAGLTVIIALAGLSVVQIPFITMMGLAAAISVFVAVLIAIIFVPALLAVAGDRISPARENRWLRKWSGQKKNKKKDNAWGVLITRKPWIISIISILILTVCALPFLHMELGLPDSGLKSTETTERRGYDLLAEGFGAGFNGPLIIVAKTSDGKDSQTKIAEATTYIKDIPGVASVSPAIPSPSGQAAIITVLPKTGPHDIRTTELVQAIRDQSENVLKKDNVEIMVTGGTAVNIDISEKLQEALPKFALLIVGLAFVLLMLVFRSILVPIKAVAGFLFTLGSTLGFIVWVIQDGYLGSLFGIPEPGPVLSFLPILVTGILFGLAMDYEVFLVSRMREDYTHTGDAHRSVRSGLTHSGPVVTAAGLIMIAVFASFIFAEDTIIKSMGLALAFGILVDAFIVRMTLVPAVMTIIGKHAWYLPKWLDRILPNIDIEGESIMQENINENRVTNHMKTRTKIIISLLIIILMIAGIIVRNLSVYVEDNNYAPAVTTEKFRVALSVSPFSGNAFKTGHTYTAGDVIAKNREELEKMYISSGATEMYARIATKRYPTEDNIVNGEEDSNANYHTLEQGLELARMAAKLNIPLNPEIMLAYTYMDMDRQQAPNFEEYPEIYALQNGKHWEELTLDEMNIVLEAYGKFVATEILKTGVKVENWNIGNEANYGFAGVSIGLKTAVNEKLEKVQGFMRHIYSVMGTNWLKNNIWKYNAVQMTSVAKGIKDAYNNLGLDSSNVKFSTHIATVVTTVHTAVTYFKTLKENGFPIDTAGISFYPSAPGVYIDKMVMYKKIVTAINKEVGIPVFIAEFSYPSGEVQGAYAGWSKTIKGYPHNEEGQAAIYHDVVQWGKTHGLIGIRYWAPDFREWGSMSMFDYSDHGAKAKKILMNAISEETN